MLNWTDLVELGSKLPQQLELAPRERGPSPSFQSDASFERDVSWVWTWLREEGWTWRVERVWKVEGREEVRRGSSCSKAGGEGSRMDESSA